MTDDDAPESLEEMRARLVRLGEEIDACECRIDACQGLDDLDYDEETAWYWQEVAEDCRQGWEALAAEIRDLEQHQEAILRRSV